MIILLCKQYLSPCKISNASPTHLYPLVSLCETIMKYQDTLFIIKVQCYCKHVYQIPSLIHLKYLINQTHGYFHYCLYSQPKKKNIETHRNFLKTHHFMSYFCPAAMHAQIWKAGTSAFLPQKLLEWLVLEFSVYWLKDWKSQPWCFFLPTSTKIILKRICDLFLIT